MTSLIQCYSAVIKVALEPEPSYSSKGWDYNQELKTSECYPFTRKQSMSNTKDFSQGETGQQQVLLDVWFTAGFKAEIWVSTSEL